MSRVVKDSPMRTTINMATMKNGDVFPKNSNMNPPYGYPTEKI